MTLVYKDIDSDIDHLDLSPYEVVVTLEEMKKYLQIKIYLDQDGVRILAFVNSELQFRRDGSNFYSAVCNAHKRFQEWKKDKNQGEIL